ncbi:phosphotransferase family protein [Nocardia aurantia]|uniref:Aminoglycoside phosphotransferase domain-containing protein n=1 Tax=Nocardia aurantia TaxID=2585199 RepID=A0A7K0DJZ0_9NOCA|nr:phosphotransferase [Nocardia aurantia]MQY25967.1 hypothetical protein [Nocardia aurantia]
MGIPDRAAYVRDVVVACLPGYRIESVTLLGAGQDNTAYEVNAELIVRFAAESDPRARATRVEAEARLLTAVAGISPIPVPEPRFVAPERGCLAYGKVPGTPLIELEPARRAAHADSIAVTLGRFLDALHAVPVERFAGLVDVDHEPTTVWHNEATRTYESVAGEIPRARRSAVESFLAAPPPDDARAPVFSHNDLGIEHILVEPHSGTVTGVIDWSDAAITDAAYDFGLIYRDLGSAALDTALRHCRTREPESLRVRAAFYARCAALEDMAYGLETGDRRYLDLGRAALSWLYPAGVDPEG